MKTDDTRVNIGLFEKLWPLWGQRKQLKHSFWRDRQRTASSRKNTDWPEQLIPAKKCEIKTEIFFERARNGSNAAQTEERGNRTGGNRAFPECRNARARVSAVLRRARHLGEEKISRKNSGKNWSRRNCCCSSFFFLVWQFFAHCVAFAKSKNVPYRWWKQEKARLGS